MRRRPPVSDPYPGPADRDAIRRQLTDLEQEDRRATMALIIAMVFALAVAGLVILI